MSAALTELKGTIEVHPVSGVWHRTLRDTRGRLPDGWVRVPVWAELPTNAGTNNE